MRMLVNVCSSLVESLRTARDRRGGADVPKRESSYYSPVAQSVEQLAVNQLVGGSNPSRGASLDQMKRPFDRCRWAFLALAHQERVIASQREDRLPYGSNAKSA
jgi:hypothetical protein